MLYDMRNVFPDLKPPDGIPPEGLKQEVFNSLETLQLIADVIDLFTSQFVLSESDMLALFDSDFYIEDESPENGSYHNPENDEYQKNNPE